MGLFSGLIEKTKGMASKMQSPESVSQAEGKVKLQDPPADADRKVGINFDITEAMKVATAVRELEEQGLKDRVTDTINTIKSVRLPRVSLPKITMPEITVPKIDLRESLKIAKEIESEKWSHTKNSMASAATSSIEAINSIHFPKIPDIELPSPPKIDISDSLKVVAEVEKDNYRSMLNSVTSNVASAADKVASLQHVSLPDVKMPSLPDLSASFQIAKEIKQDEAEHAKIALQQSLNSLPSLSALSKMEVPTLPDLSASVSIAKELKLEELQAAQLALDKVRASLPGVTLEDLKNVQPPTVPDLSSSLKIAQQLHEEDVNAAKVGFARLMAALPKRPPITLEDLKKMQMPKIDLSKSLEIAQELQKQNVQEAVNTVSTVNRNLHAAHKHAVHSTARSVEQTTQSIIDTKNTIEASVLHKKQQVEAKIQQVKDTVEHAKTQVIHAKDSVQQTAHNVTAAVHKTAEQTKENIAKAQQTAHHVKQTVEDIREGGVEGAKQKIKEKVAETVDHAKASVLLAKQEAERKARRKVFRLTKQAAAATMVLVGCYYTGVMIVDDVFKPKAPSIYKAVRVPKITTPPVVATTVNVSSPALEAVAASVVNAAATSPATAK